MTCSRLTGVWLHPARVFMSSRTCSRLDPFRSTVARSLTAFAVVLAPGVLTQARAADNVTACDTGVHAQGQVGVSDVGPPRWRTRGQPRPRPPTVPPWPSGRCVLPSHTGSCVARFLLVGRTSWRSQSGWPQTVRPSSTIEVRTGSVPAPDRTSASGMCSARVSLPVHRVTLRLRSPAIAMMCSATR